MRHSAGTWNSLPSGPLHDVRPLHRLSPSSSLAMSMTSSPATRGFGGSFPAVRSAAPPHSNRAGAADAFGGDHLDPRGMPSPLAATSGEEHASPLSQDRFRRKPRGIRPALAWPISYDPRPCQERRPDRRKRTPGGGGLSSAPGRQLERARPLRIPERLTLLPDGRSIDVANTRSSPGIDAIGRPT